jgi:hypothetical protein
MIPVIMPRPRLLLLALLLPAAAFAQLQINVTSGRFAAPDGDVHIAVQVVNATSSEAQNVHVQSALGTLTLDHPLAAGASASFDVPVHLDQPFARRDIRFDASATIDGKTQSASAVGSAVLYKRFLVASTADAGPGTLRAAVEAVNADADCASVPCSIDFDGAKTIALLSPLPQIAAADLLIDGPAEVDGAAAGSGNGLDFNVRDRADVADLALRNFGDNAILVRDRVRTKLGDTTPRLYVTHCTIEHNFRGIGLSQGWFDGGEIRDCNISNNVRTGIFDWSDHDPGLPLEPVLHIVHNVISGNGASGVFLGDGSDGALLIDNTIEHNRDFGVAVGPNAINVRIMRNSIAHNGNSAIDLGLDGPSALVHQRLVPSPLGDRTPAVISSAVYDSASNTTVITGLPAVRPLTPCDLCRSDLVSVWANDSAEHGEYAEAQTYLGDAQQREDGGGWILTVPGDLRGKWLTALDTIWLNIEAADFFNAGELSKAFFVHVSR